MSEILNLIEQYGIIPVVVIDDVEDAVPLAKALCDGGLACAEVTFRTAAAKESIRKMSEAFPHMLIGAGTVLTTKQVDEAVEAGAKFIVSPGLNPNVVSYCVKKNILIIPGCANPSDIEIALSLGLSVVKFFPAEAAGGLAMIKAMAAPYTNVRFMPTGGISEKNLNAYLAFDKIVACGGSWMVNGAFIKEGDFEKITLKTQEAIELMLGFEIALLNKPLDDALVVKTNSIERAIFYLEKKGYTICSESGVMQKGKYATITVESSNGLTIKLIRK